MAACSTASLGALSLAGGAGLGQAFTGPSPMCASLSRMVSDDPENYPSYAEEARRQGCQVGTAPSPNGNGDDTAMWGFLSNLVGAVPGMIHGPTPGTPPPLVQYPAARTGIAMLPLIALGVVVWMVARPARRRRD